LCQIIQLFPFNTVLLLDFVLQFGRPYFNKKRYPTLLLEQPWADLVYQYPDQPMLKIERSEWVTQIFLMKNLTGKPGLSLLTFVVAKLRSKIKLACGCDIGQRKDIV